MSDSESKPMTTEEVAELVDGVIECEIKLPLYPHLVRMGYQGLRKAMLWAAKESETEIPEHIQYTLRWLRENFGPLKDRTGKRV